MRTAFRANGITHQRRCAFLQAPEFEQSYCTLAFACALFLADIANGIGPRMPAVKRMLLKKLDKS
jgi:hypothetical protein